MKFIIIGIVCLTISIWFGFHDTVEVIVKSGGAYRPTNAPNITTAGASLGLAIAGGLSLIASALNKGK